jgi:hypothetical protein
LSWVFERPFDLILPVALLVLAVWFFVRGTRLLSRGLNNPEHPSQTLWVVRGFRGGITALAVIAFAGGIYFHTKWPLLLGAVFLGEELLETGVMILALKNEEKAKKRAKS